MKKTGGSGGKGHTSKHAGTHKHHAHGAKHHPKHQSAHHAAAHHLAAPHAAHTKAKHPHHARGYAIGDWLPVCALEAVAQSLRLAGQPVADDEVAWLWELSGSRELTIAEALAAAVRFGVAGFRPFKAEPLLGELREPRAELLIDLREDLVGSPSRPLGEFIIGRHALILGVDRPGPHAVLATPDGWWSWGELWSPWTTAVSEAWVVSWS